MNPPNVRDQLLQNNPFFSGTAKDPWENSDPDVISLNQTAYEQICGLIRAKYQNPAEGLAGLVLGDAGMGKTHLLKRLLNYARHRSISVTFASVRAFLDPNKRKRHLLSEIAINLARVQTSEELSNDTANNMASDTISKISQFEYLVTKIMQVYNKYNHGSNGFQGNGFQEWSSYFQNRNRGIHGNLLKAIFFYNNDSGKRNLILNWLEGRVHEDHVSVMNFPDRALMDDLALEAEAHDIIVSLGMLLKYCGMSMAICFDQLDGMKDKRLLEAFGDVVHLLVNDVSSMLPLVFVRMDTWNERFYDKLDSSVTGRLRSNVIHLWGCTVIQAEELIKERVRHRFKNDGAEEKIQWLMEQLKGKLKENDSPREIIYLANRAITGYSEPLKAPKPLIDDPEAIKKALNIEYLQERDKVARDFDKWPPDAERMSLALTTYLKSRPEYSSLQPGSDKFVTLTGKYRNSDGSSVDCAFIINTAEHPMTVQACFNRAVKFLEKHTNGRCYYISDKRCTFRDRTRWKKVHELKDEFDNQRGVTLFLDRQQAVSWYGLVSLIFKLEAGDVTLPTDAGLRTAKEKDFEIYMKDGFDGKFLEATEQEVSIGTKGTNDTNGREFQLDEEQLEKKMVVILKQSPMRLMLATLLLGKLQKGGEKITYELLLEFAGKHQEVFIIYPSGDGSMISLK